MARYKLFKYGEFSEGVIDKEAKPLEILIPFDPNNTDYQKYLEWVAEGNTAEAAD
tara:strand:- start:40 stop:204 length:165 start_codon:yes stop_codon:yes gene_type:complete